MRIERVDHVELLVPDRYEAARFYKVIFGFEIRRDLEFWAQDQNGPLMISPVTGGPKLALFDGEPPTSSDSGGFRRIAFGVSGADFLGFAERERIPTKSLLGLEPKDTLPNPRWIPAQLGATSHQHRARRIVLTFCKPSEQLFGNIKLAFSITVEGFGVRVRNLFEVRLAKRILDLEYFYRDIFAFNHDVVEESGRRWDR